jgi:GntR family transcriptional regulator/MocR family aminotransferase
MRSRGWAELYDWRLDRDSATPVFRQIYAQVRAAVLARTLGPGTRLPSSRALAAQLGAARASVVAAYDQLLAEGYVFGRTGSGTYVSGARRRRHRRALSPNSLHRRRKPTNGRSTPGARSSTRARSRSGAS